MSGKKKKQYNYVTLFIAKIVILEEPVDTGRRGMRELLTSSLPVLKV